MPIAIVIGCAPVDLLHRAAEARHGFRRDGRGRRASGRAVKTVRCITNDLEVPADSEIVIEGVIDTELLEPEGPFGESHTAMSRSKTTTCRCK